MPAIDDIADDDFIAIRMQSDDFHELRSALGRVLEKTNMNIKQGESLIHAFRSNLDEIELRASSLRKETRDKSLPKFLKSTLQAFTLGALTSTAGAASADLMRGNLHPGSLVARLLTTAAVGTLLTALQYKSPGEKYRLLRFYEVIVDPQTNSRR